MAIFDRAYNVMAAAMFHHSDKGELVVFNHVKTKSTTVSFSVTQTITGISLEQYNSNSGLDTTTLTRAITETMNDVLPADIKNFHVTAGHSTAGAKSANAPMIAHDIHASSIVLMYDVVVTTTRTAEELMNQLTAAVHDGTFNEHLQAAASANEAAVAQKATPGVPWARSASLTNPLLLTQPSPSKSPVRTQCSPAGLTAV